MGFMALLGHQTPHQAVITPVPAIIEAPKGVVEGEAYAHTVPAARPQRLEALLSTTSLPLYNPNSSFMDTHVPENTPAPEPVEPQEVEKPAYIAPAEETPGHVNGTEYSTGGY